MGSKYVEYIRDGIQCSDKVMTGEIRLTITLPPGVDTNLPRGPIEIDLGAKGVRNLYAYQFGSKSCCRLCGGDSCFQKNAKRCLHRCKYCGLPFNKNHVEETCIKQHDMATVDQKWLVNKIEEDLVRKNMPVINLSADVKEVCEEMAGQKASAWRDGVSKTVVEQVHKVEDESKIGAENDLNPYKDEKTRAFRLSKSAKNRKRKAIWNGNLVDNNFAQSRLEKKFGEIREQGRPLEPRPQRGNVHEDVYVAATQVALSVSNVEVEVHTSNEEMKDDVEIQEVVVVDATSESTVDIKGEKPTGGGGKD